jgi:hypothetical protein
MCIVNIYLGADFSEFLLFKALVLAAIGRVHELDDDMCGLVVSSRAEEDIISVKTFVSRGKKVSSMLALSSKYTRALNFQNFETGLEFAR